MLGTLNIFTGFNSVAGCWQLVLRLPFKNVAQISYSCEILTWRLGNAAEPWPHIWDRLRASLLWDLYNPFQPPSVGLQSFGAQPSEKTSGSAVKNNGLVWSTNLTVLKWSHLHWVLSSGCRVVHCRYLLHLGTLINVRYNESTSGSRTTPKLPACYLEKNSSNCIVSGHTTESGHCCCQ